jgi:hypothetical protein
MIKPGTAGAVCPTASANKRAGQSLPVKIKYFFTRRTGCRDDRVSKKYNTPASLCLAGVRAYEWKGYFLEKTNSRTRNRPGRFVR